MNRNVIMPIWLMLVGLIVSSLSLKAQNYSQSSGTTTQTNQSYSSSTADESAVKVTGGTLSLSSCTVTKSGNTSSSDNSSFYGVNAAVLSSGSSSVINMTGGTITTAGTGANAVVAYGGTVNISSVTINCSNQYSRGIHATNGGIINATNLTATTSGANSSIIATDRGGGTVTVSGGNFTVTGTDAAVIYSTGAITVDGITGTSANGEAGVVEGTNSITINNSTVTSGSASRGVLILQSGSGDATGVVGTFTMTNGTLTSTNANAPLFEVVTNSTGHITLNNVTTSNSSGTLMKVDYNTRWTTNGATGNLYLNGSKTYNGNILADSYSSAGVNILTGATLVGAVNNANTAKLVTLTMDCNSIWTVTATSYINGLITNPCISGTSVPNITGNGNNVFYTASTNSALGGLIYTLAGGGYLLPTTATVPTNTTSTTNIVVSVDKKDLQITPNPFEDKLKVSYSLDKLSTVTISIIDISGKTVVENQFKGQNSGMNLVELSVPQIKTGEYIVIVKIENENGTTLKSKKVIRK